MVRTGCWQRNTAWYGLRGLPLRSAYAAELTRQAYQRQPPPDAALAVRRSAACLRGSWVVFATVALAAASGVTGTSVQTGFLLDGEIYSTFVQSDFVVADILDGGVSGFRVVPLTTGLALDRPRTIQVGCMATEPETVSSHPTTITAIQVYRW